MHLGNVHVEKISLSKRFWTEFAEVEEGAGKVNVLNMFLGAAGVAEAFLANFAAVPIGNVDNFMYR
jgi:hypothetical protein